MVEIKIMDTEARSSFVPLYAQIPKFIEKEPDLYELLAMEYCKVKTIDKAIEKVISHRQNKQKS
jgi:hypothetical protein